MGAEFKELARLQVSDATEIVASQVIVNGAVTGFNINPYITSAKYTGFSKGIFVPADKMSEFKKMVGDIK